MKKLLLILVISSALLPVSAQKKYPIVTIETSIGEMQIQLYDDTPLHSANFVKLVNEGYYNNQLFHRVIKNFMIQAGDPNSINAQPGARLGVGGPSYTIPAEILPSHFHKKGVIAAARQGDNINPKRESSGSQFYIVAGQIIPYAQLDEMVKQGSHKQFTDEEIEAYTSVGGTPHLDDNYTVFGELIKGTEVLDSISNVLTDRNNRPLSDVKILKVYIKK